MFPTNEIWIVLFIINIIIIYWLHHSVIRLVKDKPLGLQTLVDSSSIDGLRTMWLTGTTYSFVAILSRIDLLQDVFQSHDVLLVSVCALYQFTFFSVSLIVALVCILRSLCLLNMAFIEEKIGERNVKIIQGGLTFMISLILLIIEIFSGDIKTGTSYSMVVRQWVPPGNFF